MASNAIKGARRRPKVGKFVNDLTLDEAVAVWESQKSICAATGVKLDRNNPNPLLRPSLDRINSDIGYTYKNIRFVCRAYNHLKVDFTEYEAKNALTAMLKATMLRT